MTVRHSKLMHHRLTEVPELLSASHSAYETAVESFPALVRMKMARTRLEEYLGILGQSPRGDAARRDGGDPRCSPRTARQRQPAQTR